MAAARIATPANAPIAIPTIAPVLVVELSDGGGVSGVEGLLLAARVVTLQLVPAFCVEVQHGNDN